MSRPLIAFVPIICLATLMSGQSASTNRRATAKKTPPVTITVDDANQKSASAEADDPQQSEEKAKDKRVHALLDRAYLLSEQLPPEEKIQVLTPVVDLAGDHYREKVMDWAEVLWNTSRDLPDDLARYAQGSAISAMAHVDPDKALTFLRHAQANAAATTGSSRRRGFGGQGAPGFAATMVFDEYQHKHGDAALPQLQSTARAMAKNGAYPYLAMSSQIVRISEKRGDEAPPDERIASMFRDALDAYQSAPAHTNDIGFSEFLSQTVRRVPRDMATEAVTTITHTLLAAEPDNNNAGEVTIGDKAVLFKGSSDYALLRLMPVIKELDPALLAEVLKARPDFAGAQDGRFRGLRNGFVGVTPDRQTPQTRQMMQNMNTRRANMRMARTDPDKALATAATMSDPADKANLLANTAMFMAEKSPEDAARILDQAQKVAAEVKDQMAELRVIVSSVEAARRLKQTQRVHDLMARGFELGSQLMRTQMDDNPDAHGQVDALGYMNALVMFGMSDDPDGVTAVIDAVAYPLPKAMLYTTAARSVQWGHND